MIYNDGTVAKNLDDLTFGASAEPSKPWFGNIDLTVKANRRPY